MSEPEDPTPDDAPPTSDPLGPVRVLERRPDVPLAANTTSPEGPPSKPRRTIGRLLDL